ncbi:carboxymuconolactone decarboxylase family protein [Geotalea uraniireducens]|uniref:Carboxymuconolactone decarboxylase n=1 Tax=Geotalea uraniireducens (strain Rf4) TaxID=351605 RepID=A5G4H8_GEOUR|nr:carboxymuconolactone decarboxylase family protein [Geotalea uraniireducens]ABQ26696.1 Carboxymuconolactone decarboxylase [Geotalea uraniireducens Rf4]
MVEIPSFMAAIKESDPVFYEKIIEMREFAYKDGALSSKIKLLMIMLMDAAYGSKIGCAKISDMARRVGATEEEIRETVRLSFIMGGLNGISSGLGAYFGFDFEKNDICNKSKMITK